MLTMPTTTLSKPLVNEIIDQTVKHLEATGESVPKLAARSGWSKSNLYQFIEGEYGSPSIDKAVRLCEAIGCVMHVHKKS